ncbi:unnamed protein product [Echinostoma caproni]|uniref:Protein arginine N-methyltransferase 7 n=1 Tax=Echinostoma caproni TaxID=27848 RepID=A0A183AKF0_9TREM|nr:unnamed protein product [Echinostoma caproni]
MEPTGTVPDISTAPIWVNDPDATWRDHWMQAVYFPTHPLTLVKGQPVQIHFRHDLLSLWFDLPPPETTNNQPSSSSCSSMGPERPVCECGLHYAWPRTRIAQLQTADYQTSMTRLVDGLSTELKRMALQCVHILTVSDCSLLPIFLSESLGFEFAGHTVRFDHIETSACSSRFLQSVYSQVLTEQRAPTIQLSDSASSWIQTFREHHSVNTVEKQCVFVVAEPFAVAATLPWDAMHFWYAFDEVRVAFPDLDVRLYSPRQLRIWAVLVEFEQLWKIRAPIGSDCEGFNLTAFDRLVQPAMRQTHATVEPQPLWEYAGEARSTPQVIFDVDFATLQSDTQTVRHPQVHLEATNLSETPHKVNGIAFWAEWLMPKLETDPVESGHHWYAPAGPSCSIRSGEQIRWKSTGVQQGVTLFPTALTVSGANPFSIPIDVSFHVACGEFHFEITTSEG